MFSPSRRPLPHHSISPQSNPESPPPTPSPAVSPLHISAPPPPPTPPPPGGSSWKVAQTSIVGYSQSELKSGNTAAGAQFVAVGAEAMDLTDIVPTGYNKDTYEGGTIYIQSLDYKGKMVTGSAYYWYDDEDGTGWFDGSDEEVVKGQVTFAPGEAVWIRANSTSEKLQSSGEVAATSIDVYLRSGNKLICNPTPVAVNWNDDDNNGKFISVSGYGEDYEGGSIYAQQLDYRGKMVTGSAYYWYDDEDGTGWFDGSDEFVENVSLPAGAGIWVKANSTSEKVNFPAAL